VLAGFAKSPKAANGMVRIAVFVTPTLDVHISYGKLLMIPV